MATWHQKQATPKLWHETKWVVVEDPPGCMMTTSLHESKADAEAYVERRRAHGGCNMFILQPSNLKYK